MTRTAFKLIRLGALAAPGIYRAAKGGRPEDVVNDIFAYYTGYNVKDRKFRWEWLMQGWGPYLGAVFTTYGIPKLVSIIRRL